MTESNERKLARWKNSEIEEDIDLENSDDSFIPPSLTYVENEGARKRLEEFCWQLIQKEKNSKYGQIDVLDEEYLLKEKESILYIEGENGKC